MLAYKAPQPRKHLLLNNSVDRVSVASIPIGCISGGSQVGSWVGWHIAAAKANDCTMAEITSQFTEATSPSL
jgi:hypothetical protein